MWNFRDNPTTPFEVSSYSFWSNETPVANMDSYIIMGLAYVPMPIIVYTGDSIGDPTVYRNIYGRMLELNQVHLPILLKN